MARFVQKLSILRVISFVLALSVGQILANIPVLNNSYPGGIAVIDFETSLSKPKATYSNVKLLVQKVKENHWQTIVGIPLLTKPGTKEIVIIGAHVQRIKFEVNEHLYEEQIITLTGKNKKYVSPNITQTDRINKERKALTIARKKFSGTAMSDGFFIAPVDGNITSSFGSKRTYNGEDGLPHTGIDFSGNIGTKVKSSASGKVILVGDFFFNGNCIFINHGKGLISAYMHLNKTQVKYGQKIQQGDIIGTIGKTGRSTGPHLHWSVYLNGTVVNPLLLLEKN